MFAVKKFQGQKLTKRCVFRRQKTPQNKKGLLSFQGGQNIPKMQEILYVMLGFDNYM